MLSIAEIKPDVASVVLEGLNSTNEEVGTRAAKRIQNLCKDYGLPLKDYLNAAIIPGQLTADKSSNFDTQTGYVTALEHLKLCPRDDAANGMSVQLASEIFYSQPGSRLLYPEVILDMVRWKNNTDDQFVTVAPLLAQERTLSGTNQMIMAELTDPADDSLQMFSIPEGSEIPIRKIGMTDRAVKFYKIGQGYEITYEASRRMAIDLLTPFVNRANRVFEIHKVSLATTLLINGNGLSGGIQTTDITLTSGNNLDYFPLLDWLVNAAAEGHPIDTVIGNYKSLFAYMKLFAPVTGTISLPNAMAGSPANGPTLANGISMSNFNVRFAISHNAPDGTLIGITKSEALEQLTEAGSDIVENDRIIENQVMKFVRTQSLGFNLVMPFARRALRYSTD